LDEEDEKEDHKICSTVFSRLIIKKTKTN